MKKLLLSIFALCLFMQGFSQVGINILVPDSSAALQVFSNKKGLGLPQLTNAQMNAIPAPLTGLTVYNTTDSIVYYWNGQCWLQTYEPNCYYCDFQMTINPATDTLDRAVADSVVATVTVTHTHGTQPITCTWSAIPPSGVQIYSQGNTTIDSNGTFNIVVSANVFSGSGSVPILVTAYCGNQARFVTFDVYIKPCVQVNIVNDYSSYNVQGLNSTLLPAGSLQCVLVTVNSGVTVHSTSDTIASLNIGDLNPNSIVGILNYGAILGRGGDGGGFQTTTVGGNPGGNGGNALNLTTNTAIQNFGEIYAGGGGGGSIGLSYTSPSIPIIGAITIGFGVGGGGGSESGQGGVAGAPGGLTLGYFVNGNSATSTVASVPGTGGDITAAIPITISVATITITPNVQGGNGGGFAQSGTSGSASVGLQVCVQIPFLGSICPLNITLPIPIGGAGGGPGLAIERNGNPLQGIADGTYNSFQIKGTVAP